VEAAGDRAEPRQSGGSAGAVETSGDRAEPWRSWRQRRAALGRGEAPRRARSRRRPASSPRRRREPSNSCPWSCTTARASVIEGVRFRSKLYHSGLLVGAMIEKSRVPDSGRQRRAGEEVAGYCSLRTPSI
ncbi:unnamed protein product, partial [Prorocentrum cordatum]